MFLSNILFSLRAQKTSGTVVGYKTSRSAKGGGGEAEIVEFKGQIWENRSIYGKSVQETYHSKGGTPSQCIVRSQ